jgi:hypothetical protein
MPNDHNNEHEILQLPLLILLRAIATIATKTIAADTMTMTNTFRVIILCDLK